VKSTASDDNSKMEKVCLDAPNHPRLTWQQSLTHCPGLGPRRAFVTHRILVAAIKDREQFLRRLDGLHLGDETNPMVIWVIYIGRAAAIGPEEIATVSRRNEPNGSLGNIYRLRRLRLQTARRVPVNETNPMVIWAVYTDNMKFAESSGCANASRRGWRPDARRNEPNGPGGPSARSTGLIEWLKSGGAATTANPVRVTSAHPAPGSGWYNPANAIPACL
jgi:hypothetical protein